MWDVHPVSTSSWQQGPSSDREMSLSQRAREARAGLGGRRRPIRGPLGAQGASRGERTDQPFRGAQGAPWGLCRLPSGGLTMPQGQDTHSHLWGGLAVIPAHRVGSHGECLG